MTNELGVLSMVERIVTIAVLFQMVEFHSVRRDLDEGGVWRWSVIRRSFSRLPKAVRWVLDRTLASPNVHRRGLLGGGAAALNLMNPHPVLVGVMFVVVGLLSVRFFGAFNGGADSMTLLVLAAIALGSTFPEMDSVVTGCLLYVAIQACASYFVAGLVKLRSPSWRNGRALAAFMESPMYQPPKGMARLLARPGLAVAASWVVIAFELGFPLALVSPELSRGFVVVAFGFHGMNFYLFGLNRFVLAWAATYPAVVYFSTLVG